ncbi:MAG TPA: sulfotransferase [Candidatus Sulfotelmatobacter sp.]|jgi:hypothetical protein
MLNWRSIPLGSLPGVKPVFIVGAGRSGTTPLQLALNMHPRLGVYGETQAFFVYRKFASGPADARTRQVLNYWTPLIAGCSPYADLFDDEGMRARLASASNYAEIVNQIFGTLAAREGKSRWGEKSPAHIFRLQEIRSSFPGAQVIHIIRDPRAVVCSSIKAFDQGQLNDWNIYRVARYWLRCFKIHAQQQSETARGGYMLVRYEDFVLRPQETLQAIAAFLNIGFVTEMLNAHRVASRYVQKESSGGMPAHHALTEKPLDASRVQAWKASLSREQTRLVEQVAGKQMQEIGYQPAEKEPYKPPSMRAVYFSTRWIAAEGRRIADKQARTPYWALQRMMESRDQAQQTPPARPANPVPSLDSSQGPKRNTVGVRPNEEPEQIRRSGT